MGMATTVSFVRSIAVAEIRSEFLKAVRLPAYTLPTLAFPAMFYVIFGIVFGKQSAGQVSMATYLLATYGTFGVIGAAFFGFGVGIAVERGQGWLLLKQASPLPAWGTFVGKMAMAAAFGAAIVAMLFALGLSFGGVQTSATTLLALAGILIAGTIPFAALGLTLGYLAGPNSAPAIVNLIYLPMAFVSGLWLPIQFLPEIVQTIAQALPAYHLAQLALRVIGADQGQPVWVHLAYLAIFTVVCIAAGRILMRRDRGRTYG